MKMLLWVHIAAGIIALVCGTKAFVARKGSRLYSRAGTCFFGSMPSAYTGVGDAKRGPPIEPAR